MRAEILRRDGYACRHCGRQAPEVVLQIWVGWLWAQDCRIRGEDAREWSRQYDIEHGLADNIEVD